MVALRCLACALTLATFTAAQSITASDSDGYTGYNLNVSASDGQSVAYETDGTDTLIGDDGSLGPPDVFLNASVNVGEIDILVQNLSAKINLDAQVLQLLQFSAGVDVSIDRVDLTIQNVTAKVLLEARLGNLVNMVDDVLDSVDLNPLIASLGGTLSDVGEGVGQALNDTGAAVGSALNNLTARSDDGLDRVLFSSNNYQGNTHRNRILENDGSIVDQNLDNDGRVSSQTPVGNYATDFSPLGDSREVQVNGQTLKEQEYVYAPYYGLNIVSLISFDASGKVVSARVLSEVSAGGTSTISAD